MEGDDLAVSLTSSVETLGVSALCTLHNIKHKVKQLIDSVRYSEAKRRRTALRFVVSDCENGWMI
jgi:hypothetical protein